MLTLDMEALKRHARLVAIEHLLQTLYYMHYRQTGATQPELEEHHKNLLNQVRNDLVSGLDLEVAKTDPEQSKTISREVLAAIDKQLTAIRSMFATTPRGN